MDFKKISFQQILVFCLSGVVILAVIVWKLTVKTDDAQAMMNEDSAKVVSQPVSDQMAMVNSLPTDASYQDDAALEQQLEHDRQEQRETKLLKTKLEQTDLELQEQKALAEINKLKMENMDGFNDNNADGPKNLPEVKIAYIGGDDNKKEAILLIGEKSFQVKEKSMPTDNIEVLSITDSSVTVHFSAPMETTRTIYFKPE